MCFDPINDEILLIGGTGIDAQDGNAGFWGFNTLNGEWQQKSNEVIPRPRAYSNMVYDASQKKILLFGGDHLDYLYSDTWAYNCVTQKWKQLHPKWSPSPRGGHLILFSTKSQKTFLLGGYEYALGSGIDYLSSLYRNIENTELWTFDWANESWQLVKVFDRNSNAPRPSGAGPHYLVGDISSEDELIILRDGSSSYSYVPKTYKIILDLKSPDSINTQLYGVPDGTIQRRQDPYSPSYFENNNEILDTEFYDNLPLDIWVRVPVGENKYPENNRDWGTTVYNPDRNLFYKWSGGHSAHCGTDVPLYDPQKSQ